MTTNYGTVAGYKAYVLERTGVAVPATITDGAILAALIVASEYIDADFRSLFPGQKTGLRAQEREWPRNGAYDDEGQTIASDVIPVEVERATYEAASVQLATPGSLRTNAAMGTAIQSVSVEGAVSVTYAGASDIADLQLSIPAVFAALAPILTGNRGTSRYSGKSVRG